MGKQPSSILRDIYVPNVPLTILNSVGWDLLSVRAVGYPKPNSLKKKIISPMSALWTTLDLMYAMEKIINLNLAIKVVLRRAYTVL